MNKKFLILISKIKDPEIFLGVARILNVPLVDENDKPYTSVDMLDNIMKHFSTLSRRGKRNLIKLLKGAL